VSEVYVIGVAVQGMPNTGLGMMTPKWYYTDKNAAEKRANDAQNFIQQCRAGTIAAPTPSGIKKMCTVEEFMAALCISNIGHALISSELTGAVETLPGAGRIILAR